MRVFFLEERSLYAVSLLVIVLLFGEAAVAVASEQPIAKPAPLLAGIEIFEPHSLLGQWNGHVHKFGRHPKLYITHCQDGVINGTYRGIFGRFPVSGHYDDKTGDITVHVDFSKSILTKLKRLKSGHGVIEANIKDGVLIGRASIPDLGPKTLRWEAVKEAQEDYKAEAGTSPE